MKKTLLAAAAVLFVAASPALAQSYDPDIGSGNLDSWPYTSNPDNPYAAQVSPYGAYGSFPYYGAYSYDPYYGAYVPEVRRRHRRHVR
jgi:hypothetical protein